MWWWWWRLWWWWMWECQCSGYCSFNYTPELPLLLPLLPIRWRSVGLLHWLPFALHIHVRTHCPHTREHARTPFENELTNDCARSTLRLKLLYSCVRTHKCTSYERPIKARWWEALTNGNEAKVACAFGVLARWLVDLKITFLSNDCHAPTQWYGRTAPLPRPAQTSTYMRARTHTPLPKGGRGGGEGWEESHAWEDWSTVIRTRLAP